MSMCVCVCVLIKSKLNMFMMWHAIIHASCSLDVVH